jgi:hypothetical protein
MKRAEFPSLFLNYRLVRWGLVIALFAAVGGGILSGAFVFFYPKEFGLGYLVIYSFFLTLSLGAFFWLLLHHAVDAAWSVLVRRIWEHLACLFAPLLALSIPLIFLHSHIWGKASFFPLFSPGTSGFLLGISLCLLAALAEKLRRISVRSDDENISLATSRRVAFASIPCYAIGFSFISLLAWMSLQAGWVSAIWPVYFFAGAAVSSLALTILSVVWLLPAFRGKIKTDHFHLLGKLLFAFILFWAYIAFSQYFIIWYANLPAETVFFRIRAEGWTRVAGWVLILGHFFVPALLLLSRSSKTQPKFLAAIGAWLLLMHFVDLCWMLLLPSSGNLLLLAFALLISFAAIGGVLALFFLIWLGKVPLWPVADPRLKECLSLTDE